MDYIQPYLDYFSAHPDWAIVLIFLIAFGEALLIIGLFVPSTAVLVGAGILVGTGHLPFWPVFLATAIGAIVGDQLSYWAGRLFGERLKTMWPLNLYPQLVARGEDYVRLHGGKSIAIGRFVPGVKAVIPGIVGMFGMGQVFFASVNVSSGIVWTAAHVFPGILVGQGLAFAGELSGRLLVVLLLLLAILAVAGYLIRIVAAGLSPYLGHLLSRIAAWARGRNSPSMRRFARAIAPDNPRSMLVVLFAAIVVGGGIALANLAIRIVSNDAVSNLDVSILNLMGEMRNAPADEIMIIITMLGDGIVITALSLTVLLWLIWHKAYRAAIAATMAVLAGKIFVPILKSAIQRPRPIEIYDGSEAFSFPSGHATMSALVFGILAMLVSHSMGRWSRALVYAICGLVAVSIAYSRVYLGVHWLSDVLGGLLFGGVMAAVFGVTIEAIPPRRIKPLGLFVAALAMFSVAGFAHISQNHESAEISYAQPRKLVDTDLAKWQATDWQTLPPRRIDLAGKPEEAFLAQMAGNPETLQAAMQAAGWMETEKWSWRASLPYLNPNATLSELPPRPVLHEGLKAKLTMIFPVGDERVVLRVHKTDLQAVEGGVAKHIYLLSLNREHRKNGLYLYALPATLPATEGDEAELRKLLGNSANLKVIAQNQVAAGIVDLVVAEP